MKDLTISAISYLNTLPFVYGIKKSGILKHFDLQLEIPSQSAKRFLNKEVDIALIPAAALKKINSYQLINEYCIGADGKVKTVLLLSQVPLQKIKKIHLDYHSLTSVNLAKILSKHHWKIDPEWVSLDEQSEQGMKNMESIVAIGDKTFLLEKEFSYAYDFSEEWRKFTGLPFVFACWVAHDHVEESTIQDFTKALSWGVNHKKKAIEELFDIKKFPGVNIEEYLEKNIDFIFNAPKHQALSLFLDYLENIR